MPSINIYRARDFLSFAEPDEVATALEEIAELQAGDVIVTIQGGENAAEDCTVIMSTNDRDHILGSSEMIELAEHMGAGFWRGPTVGQVAHA
jgi:hypothetical protein